MAFIELTYNSKALKMDVPVNVILPERKMSDPCAGAPENLPYKTLYLYHGLGGNYSEWIRNSGIIRYAAKYGIAVVMPEVGRSWYTDTAYTAAYFTFVTKELPQVCRSYFRGMSEAREDNLVAGLSMGGYGAVKAALACPDQFCGCASLSGALDITRRGRPYILEEFRGIFNYDLETPLELESSCHDVFALARNNHSENAPFPKLYLWCGTEDKLIDMNRRFHDLLDSLEIDHCYQESPGKHTWECWDRQIQVALAYLLEN